MGLKKYHAKRNLKTSGEPNNLPKKSRSNQKLFVVQKHAARHLHYDFRLEMKGVLKSWAIPKGPSLNLNVKRLAVEVEDHPLSYGNFEGVIPKDHYGAGTVMLWDKGKWLCKENAEKAYLKGDITFELRGKKLQGLWKLIKIKSKIPDENNWLLFKLKDQYSVENKKDDLLDKNPLSVKSKRTLEAISLGKKFNKNLKKPLSGKEIKNKKPAIDGLKPLIPLKLGLKKPLPRTFSPQLCFLTSQAPEGENWLHEIKFDGYRIIAIKNNDHVKLLTRSGLDWSKHFPTLIKELKQLPTQKAILDGEIVVEDKQRISRFQLLQNAIQDNKQTHLKYYIFDLAYYEGFNITKKALIERKKILHTIFKNWKHHPHIYYTDHIQGNGKAVFEQACKFNLEGIVSKNSASLYEHKRSHHWLKTKCTHRQEFIIGGFTKPKGSRKHLGALLVGYYNEHKELIYCGKVGTGFNDKALENFSKILIPLVQKMSPFHHLEKAKETTWVKPKLVCELEFSTWTDDGLLRHPSFIGLRQDKLAKQVKKEEIRKEEVNQEENRQKAVRKEVVKQKESRKKTGRKENLSPENKTVNPTEFRLTHADQILYPTQNVTKQKLANYYSMVANLILPHLIYRPLLLRRCSTHSKGQQGCYFQKHYNNAFPKSIYPIQVQNAENDKNDFLMIKDKNGLMSLVQFDVLEIHPWGSRSNHLDKPDRIIFDLDPDPSLPWKTIALSALAIRDELEAIGLKSFVKTSGNKGLHIVIPVVPKLKWPEIKRFAHNFARRMAQKYPSFFTATITKSKRKQKIFIDYIRNTRGATTVGVYSSRAQLNAPISCPLGWEELLSIKSASRYTVSNFGKRLAKIKKDPWKGFFDCHQTVNKKYVL